jgi:thiamine-phosphate pyrophosphorylase
LPPSPRPPSSPKPRNPIPRLYAIVDVDVCAGAGHTPLDVVRGFLSAGVQLIQLRAKSWPSGPFLDLAQAAVADAASAGATIIVNDRADIAVLARASGLHVGQEDLSPEDARTLVGPDTWLGLSTHTEAQWTSAFRAPISYVAIGPVYGTNTKATGYEAVGRQTVSLVAAAAAARALPVVAIGGITLERAPAVIAAGASAVAVISDLLVGSPETRARAFMNTLG